MAVHHLATSALQSLLFEHTGETGNYVVLGPLGHEKTQQNTKSIFLEICSAQNRNCVRSILLTEQNLLFTMVNRDRRLLTIIKFKY